VTHATKTNLKGDKHHENKVRGRHTMKTNLEGDTHQKLDQTATHAIKTKLKVKHAMNTYKDGADTCHENELARRHTP